MKKIIKINKAFSLLEMIFVLVLVAALLLVGIKRYQTYRQQQNVVALQQNIELIFHALDHYYQTSCKPGWAQSDYGGNKLSQSIISQLATTGLVKNKQKDYFAGIRIEGTTVRNLRPIYQLYIIVTLDVPVTQIAWYQNRLAATLALGQKLQWRRMPSYAMMPSESSMWLMNAGLREFKENALKNTKNDDLVDASCAY